ncbi:mRNA interferase HigB [Desulfatibacillum alkenivorans DSM 16219]|jgi:mRNA interferase HigB|uniref:mRNA interferase HigB n=1 Tax=Desulfatibacillum alkenivorans DSM 16219 TaxID=1121393 RepID=A0A1M6LBN6_9BACT|nr:type II toxin-antitoxin system HigB family toxin [Desulfatibacillum alkenivorans]SHJ68657.1 mRNA interferase HigB [Desulfatibacillum alkenivorans DSM 16219]
MPKTRIIARKTLREFWEEPGHEDAQGPLEAWFARTRQSQWDSPQDIKAEYGSASILKNGRVVFNIKGNKYRLVVKISYETKQVFIRFVGTHQEYDAIDAETI